MAHTWQVRSTQLNAYKTQSIKDWAQNSANGQIPALVADASAGHFGSSKIDVRAVSGKNAIVYCGIDNLLTGAGAKFAVHIRISPTWTGSPSRAQTFFIIGDPMGSYNQGFLLRMTTAGKFEVTCFDKSNNARINFTTTSAFSATSGTPFDVYVVIDTSVTSNAVKIYTNSHGSAATLFEQANGSATIPARDRMAMPAIGIGAGEQGLSDFYFVEANAWNDTIDPTTFGTRTDFISASAFEGFSYTDPGVANVLSGTAYTFAGVTQTGSYSVGTYTDPGAGNVRIGTSYIFNNVTTTGTLTVPSSASATSGAVNISNMKETIRYVLDQANTTTGTPIDLSGSLSTRVKSILKVNPNAIKPDVNLFPLVSVYTSKKDIQNKSIAGSQAVGKRQATFVFTVVGGVWNDLTTDYRVDSADEEIEKLMENVEVVLRHYTSLNNTCNWQFPSGVTYHTEPVWGEDAHLRVGVMELQATVYY